MQMMIDMNQPLNINAYKMTLLILGYMGSQGIKMKINKNQLVIY